VSKTTGYIALVHKDKGTSYGVSFPDVPGCISAGDTFEEAVANASEALAGHLALMEADGDAMPNARTLEELKEDANFIDDSTDAVVAFIAPRADQVTTLSGCPCGNCRSYDSRAQVPAEARSAPHCAPPRAQDAARILPD
jgi:predicted RNase H-like HicB family nuclease